ncbi:hypothetical protein M413DRAFT_443360 [Hebeloma cylindrosporum]|uniref:Uncharacterized protein n=1 Tax=Hebeloma cylindrosporum TaxID=76867 RepID=A0A0C3CGY5_HEBCY|nr:hypothetical protein M413DRAFT_443360 [Hebeloma cylindrosporum h7]
MFGESESESPRVPSPWDSLMSISPSPPVKLARTPSPLPLELIPRLVPEADDGNVEYKLQLLNPSAARFARLVTQMKWRLLEGGGQAYYELGVADSGDLIGLPREELEHSLETLEMMAGEIGASVIVVKEIEVPAVLATLAKRSGEWAGRSAQKEDGTLEGGYSTVETDDSLSATEVDFESEDLSATVVLDKSAAHSTESISSIFSMDSELDESEGEIPTTRYMVDLEISSVFKPRPMRARMHNHPHYAHSTGGKNKRTKKHKHLSMLSSSPTTAHHAVPHGEVSAENGKSQSRRQGRDRRRDEKRKALEARATHAVDAEAATSRQETIKAVPSTAEDDALIVSLEALHVGIVEEPTCMLPVAESTTLDGGAVGVPDYDDDDDVFASPTTAIPSFPTFSAHSTGESHLDVDTTAIGVVSALETVGKKEEPRLIVEALVVRKMSLGEAFLDFGGFSMI